MGNNCCPEQRPTQTSRDPHRRNDVYTIQPQPPNYNSTNTNQIRRNDWADSRVYVPPTQPSYIPNQSDIRREQDRTVSRPYIPPVQPYVPSQPDYQREQEAREQKEFDRKREELQMKSEQKHRDMLRQIEEQNRETDRRLQLKKQEQDSKFEDMMWQSRMENERKDREMEMENERIRNEYRVNLDQPNPEKERLEEEQRRIDARIRDNELKHQRDQLDWDIQAQQAEADRQQRRQKIDDDLERKREKIYEEAGERQREMDRQIEEIRRGMQMKVWNEVIETNWTNRLNALRNANKDSEQIERRCLRAYSSSSDKEEWAQILQILLKTMQDESENMTVMYGNTGKSFLIQIKDAVDLVTDRCRDLLRALRNGEDSTRLEKLSRELNRSCLEIPTLAELKHKYYSEMRNN